MNAATPAASAPSLPVRPRRRVWLWLLGGALLSSLLAAAAVVSVVTLDGDARRLHAEIAGAIDTPLQRKVQVSVGPVSLAAARAIVGWIPEVPDEAHLALQSVRSASVGVYAMDRAATAVERAELLTAADRMMTRRGWTRVVMVNDGDDTVMIFMPADADEDDTQEMCLAVCDGRDVVVAKIGAEAGPLLELVARHAGRVSL